MARPTVEPSFDEPTAPEVFQGLVDLSEVERPQWADLFLEYRLYAVTVQFLAVEQSEYGVT